MKNYQHYTVNEFVLDSYFQSWILNPDEGSNAFWQSWILSHPEKVLEIEEARGILQTLRLSNYMLPAAEVTAIWRRVQQGDVSPKPTTSVMNRVWLMAAAAVFIAAFSFFFFEGNFQPDNTYSTAFGETKTIELPDSSVVILNANSSIHFKKNWNTTTPREVWLEGEAFFDITHKINNQSFRVLTDEGVGVEVLGTTFNLYHRAKDTKVVLNTGQIRLSLPLDKKKETILMKPGELVVYNKKNYSKRNVDPMIYKSWTEKKIILDETSLEEIIRMAKDNYGIAIKVSSDKMLTQTVSGSMPVGDAENFVYQIGKAFQLSVQKKDDEFLITE